MCPANATQLDLLACLMSNLAIRADLPGDFTIDTTSSNLETITE